MTNEESNKALKRQIEHLKNQVDLDCPVFIIANEITLLYKKAMILWPEQMGHAFTTTMCTSMRISYGMCPKCGDDYEDKNNSYLCPKCVKLL